MALSITELELQSTEYLPAREVMSSMGVPGSRRSRDVGGGLLGLGGAKDGVLALYREGIFTQLGK